tara:strand:+ start:998 stop:1552 length:555 start_codon:yes stop_codon:yes gene_type:complete
MNGFVYIIRYGDLYKIGSAKNIESTINSLNPDEVIQTIEVSNTKSLEARLLRRYKKKRLPETGYFRLSEEEIIDCKKQMGPDSIIPSTLDDEFKIVITASSFAFLLSFSLSTLSNLPLLFSLSLSIVFGSIPMWIICLIGNFGGYYSTDLSLFSTWSNRLKGLIMASLMFSMSFTLYEIYHLIN